MYAYSKKKESLYPLTLNFQFALGPFTEAFGILRLAFVLPVLRPLDVFQTVRRAIVRRVDLIRLVMPIEGVPVRVGADITGERCRLRFLHVVRAAGVGRVVARGQLGLWHVWRNKLNSNKRRKSRLGYYQLVC